MHKGHASWPEPLQPVLNKTKCGKALLTDFIHPQQWHQDSYMFCHHCWMFGTDLNQLNRQIPNTIHHGQQLHHVMHIHNSNTILVGHLKIDSQHHSCSLSDAPCVLMQSWTVQLTAMLLGHWNILSPQCLSHDRTHWLPTSISVCLLMQCHQAGHLHLQKPFYSRPSAS